MEREEKIRRLLSDIENGNHIAVHLKLNWQRRSLKINGAEFGHLIRTDSHWRFLTALALRKPRNTGLADINDAILPATQLIDEIKPRNLRRELGRKLPARVAELLIHTVRRKGYRLAPHVHVVGGGEVPLRFTNDPDRWADQKTAARTSYRTEDRDYSDDPDESENEPGDAADDQ